MKKETTREKLINAIVRLAEDEYETNSDYLLLSKQSEDELIDTLIAIAEWHQQNCNSTNLLNLQIIKTK